MFDFIRTYQMDIMLVLCAACVTMMFMLFITRFLPKKRKWILIFMEAVAACLLAFDRMAYIFSGDVSDTGYVMVRVSNFMVFFLTSAIVFGFNLFLTDLLKNEGQEKKIPFRIKITGVMSVLGMILVVISQFTGLIYTFDENNVYHRESGFLIAYLIPVICPIIQYTVAFQYRKRLSRYINISLFLYIFVPIAVGIIQIFTYGISIVNMAMVLVSVSLYIFTYLDINSTVVKAHKSEIERLSDEQKRVKDLFVQTATAFVNAAEKRNAFSEGHSARVAELSERIAMEAGKTRDECDEVYYAALLHDAGAASLSDEQLERASDSEAGGSGVRREKLIVTGELLSSITAYPYLSEAVRCTHERYDGLGYPDGLKGEEIPETARTVAVADALDTMRMKKRTREPLPLQIVREEFVKCSGTQFDPKYADIMVRLIDEGIIDAVDENEDVTLSELRCGQYRDSVSYGIQITEKPVTIIFRCVPSENADALFSEPSIILFDSYDRRVHNNARAISSYRYIEFGEMWFDGPTIETNLRNTEVEITEPSAESVSDIYSIQAVRYEDHIKIRMDSRDGIVDAVIALPESSDSAYIGLTGENCIISGIEITQNEKAVCEGDIKRIADRESYIDRMESDVPNIQIDSTRSAATDGIEVRNGMRLRFHSMTLPNADLVWHCPYVVLFYSDDKKVNGAGYREYALLKLNGEKEGVSGYAENLFIMKKSDSFEGWNNWKETCKAGMECEIRIKKRGNRIITFTNNLGIVIENTTVLNDSTGHVYIALTGDHVALTDIRIL